MGFFKSTFYADYETAWYFKGQNAPYIISLKNGFIFGPKVFRWKFSLW